jgi:hypothetical protein
MRQSFMVGLFTVLFLVGLNGCCARIMPRKIVFTPELDMAIKNKINAEALKKPIVLLIGRDGRVFALNDQGETFRPCRPPTADDIQNAATDEKDEMSKQTDVRVKDAVMVSDLPICEGMKNIKGIFPVNTITIMRAKRNPIYDTVHSADGSLEQRCILTPFDPPGACN